MKNQKEKKKSAINSWKKNEQKRNLFRRFSILHFNLITAITVFPKKNRLAGKLSFETVLNFPYADTDISRGFR